MTLRRETWTEREARFWREWGGWYILPWYRKLWRVVTLRVPEAL